jgi:hypothetical protein
MKSLLGRTSLKAELSGMYLLVMLRSLTSINLS